MTFYPTNAPVPQVLSTDAFVLHPLRAAHATLDYEAVMATQDTLRRITGGAWPRPGFTPDENLADLEEHEAEFATRQAFAYTVLEPTGTSCGLRLHHPTHRGHAASRGNRRRDRSHR